MANPRLLAGLAFSTLAVTAFAQDLMPGMAVEPSTANPPPAASAMAPTSVAVTFNGAPVAFPDQGPMMSGERVFVPVGPLADWLGARVEPADGGVTLVKGARTYAAPTSALVPLRDLAAAFGGSVQYDWRTRTANVSLDSDMRQMPGGTALYSPDSAAAIYAPDAATMYAPDAMGNTPTITTGSSRPQAFVSATDGTAISSWTDYLSWIILGIAVLGLAAYLLSRKPARVIASDTDRNP